jgi:hypothetical protein
MRYADGLCRLMIIRDGPEGAADPRVLEEQGQGDHEEPTDEGCDHIGGVDEKAAWKHAFEQEHGVLGKTEVDLVDIGAPDGLPKAVEEVRDAEGGHEQDDLLLIDQAAENEELDGIGQRNHDRDGADERQPDGHHLGQASQRQCCEQHHGPLREVENAGGFENEHHAERDERVEHAHQQATDQRLQNGPCPAGDGNGDDPGDKPGQHGDDAALDRLVQHLRWLSRAAQGRCLSG